MPQAAKKLCTVCKQIGGCTCNREARRRFDERRGSARERGYDTTWDKFSAAMRSDPDSGLFWCHDCEDEGALTPADQIHHIRKLKARPDLKYEPTNLMALCERHHSKRTARGE